MESFKHTPTESEPLIFSAYPGSKQKKPILSSGSFFRRRPLLRKIAIIAPLVLGFVAYRYVRSGPFLPFSCQILGLGCPEVQIYGYNQPEFDGVRKVFERNFVNGDEIGASVTIYHEGTPVVDLQGGVRSTTTNHPYDRNTLQLVFSSSKAVTSMMVARLVEQGLLDYNEKIATYWPEFAQGNKENVTLGDLMVHRAGVSYIDHHVMKIEDLNDLDHLARILQEQPHNYNGVPTRAYHAVTRGWYLNEIIRRVDPKHRTVGQIFQEEIIPAQNVEFYYTLTEEQESRVATIYEYPILRILGKMLFPRWMVSEPLHEVFSDMMNPKSVPFKSLVGSSPNQVQPSAFNRREFHVAEGPSYSGMTNSRTMAKLGAIMANQGQPINPGESPIFTRETYLHAAEPLPPVYDEVLHETMTPTVGGWGVWRLEGVEDVEFIGWGGSGGSLFLWNEELNMSFAYCMNAFNTALLGDKRSLKMLREAIDAVKAKQAIKSSL